MAALTAGQTELISSLSQDDIPIKLRCAICSRLAVNAFRLPCCDQSICETCQSTLPSTCPVCEHSPVASEDCKPHRSLRTTIKVFLRTEEKKREALRLKEAKDTPPATPVEPTTTTAAIVSLPEPTAPVAVTGEVKAEPSTSANVTEVPAPSPEDIEKLQEAQQDIPQPSIEEIAPGQEPTLDTDANNAEAAAGAEDDYRDAAEVETSNQPAEGMSNTQAGVAGFGFDGNAASGFPGGMGFGGDLSQMQMMMAMQNGMAPNAFGSFPMMGLPGMNMDSMLMQNMFMSGGFGAGMGLNGLNSMNMGGMGVGGFDDGVGGGFNNGWNGQSWNIGQDNFTNPNAAGMGPGDYGANNSGYTPHAAGYNQGNYGRGNHYNDYQNNNSGFRGRGRGRGYGRGGYGYGSHDTSQQYQQQYGAGNQTNGPVSETGSIPTGPKADATPAGNVDEFGREIRQTSEAKDNPNEVNKSKEPPTEGAAVNGDEIKGNVAQVSTDSKAEGGEPSFPQPIQTLDEAQVSLTYSGFQNGYSNNQYSSRGGFYGARGGNFGTMHPPVKPVDVPINAPTGPKAMRQGLPNTGLSSLRGRGFSVAGSASSRVNGSTSVAPEPTEKEKGRERSRSPSRERSRSRSRDRKRSRSRSRERHHRRHRHRSSSLSEDEKETERRRQRRRERRRRREEEGDDRDDTVTGEKSRDGGKEDVDEDRSRSASPSESRRSSHRSRRERDKYRDRDRDSDREHKSSHKHRSSHRSHRDDRSRSRDRDRDRDREHRHRHSRRGSEDVEAKTDKVEASEPPTPIETEDPSRRSSLSNGTNGIEIKGASIRRKNTIEDIVIPTGPRSSRPPDKEKPSHRHREDEDRSRTSRHRGDTDKERERAKEKERAKTAPTAPAVKNPHEEEREARNRERLLKEAQRMAGLNGIAGGGRKRSRDDGDENGRRGKKKGRRSGVEESDEARIARLEAERESARW